MSIKPVELVERANKILLETVVTMAEAKVSSEKIKYVEQYVALELFELLRALLPKLLNAKKLYCEGLLLYPHVIQLKGDILRLSRNWIDLVEISLDSEDKIKEWKCREES
jgi:hypothetical protein